MAVRLILYQQQDWRSSAILNPDDAKLFLRGLAEAKKTIHLLQGLKGAVIPSKIDSVGIDHLNMLTSCGLQMLDRQVQTDAIPLRHD